MNAGALLTNVASSATSGAASEPGASLLDAGKTGAPGEVDAFTQALAALLGLPSQTLTAQATPSENTSPQPVAGPAFPQLLKEGPAFGLPSPINANAGALSGLAPTFVLATGDALAKTAMAQSLGVAAKSAPQPVGQPGATGPSAPRGASAPNAVSGALVALSVTGRIQSETVAPPTDNTGDATAEATSSALTPLAAGAGRLGPTLQPAQIAAPKATPPGAQAKAAAKTESSSTTAQSGANAAEDEPSLAPLSAAANTADDQGQHAGGHASGQTAVQSQNAQPANSNGSTNAATTLAVAPGAAATQSVTSLSTAASPIANQLATQVVKAVAGKSTHFDIALEPAGFGRVDVKLQIDDQGQVSAQFSFDTAHAAAEAKAQVGQLQQALEQAGFTVGQGGLSFDVGGQGAGLARQESQAMPPAVAALQSSTLVDAMATAPQTLLRRPVSGLDITI